MSGSNPYDFTSDAEGSNYSAEGPQKKSVVPMVFGILSICFGLFGVCGGIAGTAMMFGNFMPQDPNFPNPMLDLMNNNAGYRLFTIATTTMGVIFAVMQLIGGIGLVQYRHYGRSLCIVCAWFSIVVGIVTPIVNYFMIIQPLFENQGPDNPAAMAGIVGSLIGGCFGLVYPILLLVFMSRQDVIKWLK